MPLAVPADKLSVCSYITKHIVVVPVTRTPESHNGIAVFKGNSRPTENHNLLANR